VLEDANIKMASVLSNIMGMSGRAILAQLLEGQTDPVLLAELAQGRLRQKQALLEQALIGHLTDHHRFLLAQHLSHIDYLDEAIERLDKTIQDKIRPFEAEVAVWDSLPGIGRRLAEIGADLKPFADARQLASWAGMCPGNQGSGGQRRSGKTRRGSKWLRHARTKHSYFQAQYYRLPSRQTACCHCGGTRLTGNWLLLDDQKAVLSRPR
jgi:transposase